MKKRILASLLSAAVVMFLGVLQRPVSGNDVGPDLKDLSARENQIVPIRISPSLQKILNEKTDGDPVKVGIWLYSRNKAVAAEVAGKYPNARLLGTRPSKDTPREAARQLRQDMNAAFRGEYQRAQAPIVRLVEGRGHKVLYASTAAPLVFAEIPKSLALQIGQLAEVDTVYPVLAYKPAMDGVVQALRVNPIWDLGYTGSGIRIGVIDAPDPASTNFSAIDFAHAEIKDGDLGITNYFDLTNTTPSDHATAMSGVIASQHAIYRGVAYGAKPLLSGNPVNDTDYELISASDWAIGQGPNRGGYPIQFIPAGEEAQVLYVGVQHFTGGAMETLDRYYDHVSYWHAVTVVTAAGNIYDPADLGYVASPGLSYNSITAGAYDYSRTAFWSDDFMMGNSRWKNPPDTDREKPEVAAVGGPRSATTGIVTPYPGDVFGWTGWTSAASAEVTGLVALLMEAAPSLQGWPETVKAIVMASAIHNIEGDGRLSDKDGAGGISVEEAVNVAKSSAPQQWEQVYLTPTDFANGNW